MPEDNRDFRVRCDLTYPKENQGVAIGLINHIKNLIDRAINIYPGEPIEEKGYLYIERCGHRIGEPCEVIERYEVE